MWAILQEKVVNVVALLSYHVAFDFRMITPGGEENKEDLHQPPNTYASKQTCHMIPPTYEDNKKM